MVLGGTTTTKTVAQFQFHSYPLLIKRKKEMLGSYVSPYDLMLEILIVLLGKLIIAIQCLFFKQTLELSPAYLYNASSSSNPQSFP